MKYTCSIHFFLQHIREVLNKSKSPVSTASNNNFCNPDSNLDICIYEYYKKWPIMVLLYYFCLYISSAPTTSTTSLTLLSVAPWPQTWSRLNLRKTLCLPNITTRLIISNLYIRLNRRNLRTHWIFVGSLMTTWQPQWADTRNASSASALFPCRPRSWLYRKCDAVCRSWDSLEYRLVHILIPGTSMLLSFTLFTL